MSGWRPSSSVCGRAVVCAATVLPSAVAWLVPYSSHCSTHQYCCHVTQCSLPGVWCAGGGRVSVVFVWWGILCVLPPRRGGGWGHRGWLSAMVSEGRLYCWTPSRMPVPPSVCWRPHCRLPCGPVEWRSGMCCDALSSDWVWHLHCSAPLHIVRSLRIVPVLLLSCVAVFVVGVVCLSLLSVFLFSSLLLVFGVVRAQPCEHARYPRTPMCLLFSSLSLPAFLHAPPFFCCWNGGV